MWHYRSGCSFSKVRNFVLSWKEQWGLCCLFSPCWISWVLQCEGRAGNQLWKWNFSCKEPSRGTGILHNRQWGCSWVWPGVMESKSSLNSPMEPLGCEKNVRATQSSLGLPALPVSSVLTHFCLKEIPSNALQTFCLYWEWFLQLYVWGLLSLRLCSVAAAAAWGMQFLCSPPHPHRGPVSFGPSPFPSQTYKNFCRILSDLMIPVKWSQCWETLSQMLPKR